MLKHAIARTTDVLAAPFTIISAVLLRHIRRLINMHGMPVSKRIFNKVGVFPIRDHYYEPLFNMTRLTRPLEADRHLPGIDLDPDAQLALLEKFDFAEELTKFPAKDSGNGEYFYENGYFGPGDAEYLYSMIRLYKPATLIEIGSGYSTLVATAAIAANTAEDTRYRCRHVCIEPYENEWLRNVNIELIRTPVQDVGLSMFRALKAGDILFIDSTHVIRPQGDVLFEYLEVLPSLAPGVVVHVHDVFTPEDYPDHFAKDSVLLWNEQYLLEAILSFSSRFKVIGALNFLAHNHRSALAEKFSAFGAQPVDSRWGPKSFWMLTTDNSA